MVVASEKEKSVDEILKIISPDDRNWNNGTIPVQHLGKLEDRGLLTLFFQITADEENDLNPLESGEQRDALSPDKINERKINKEQMMELVTTVLEEREANWPLLREVFSGHWDNIMKTHKEKDKGTFSYEEFLGMIALMRRHLPVDMDLSQYKDEDVSGNGSNDAGTKKKCNCCDKCVLM